MKILITNDDGINAEGLNALVVALGVEHDVTVVAPDSERSGASQSITVHDPLRAKEIQKDDKFFGYAVDGSPADCVKLALACLLDHKPDLVISGINRGPNHGSNSLYSGTVGGALEGVVNGIPSIAVSLAGFNNLDYSISANFVQHFVKQISEIGFTDGVVYNINVPAVDKSLIKGAKFVHASSRAYLVNYEKRLDPFQHPYYWLSDFRDMEADDENSDEHALNMNYISISPIKIDRNDYNELERINKLEVALWQ